MEGVCLGSARFKLLISARTVLLTVTSLVVVGVLFSPGLLGSCTLIFLSRGAGAFPDDCIDVVVVVVVDALLVDCIDCIVASVEVAAMVVLELLFEDLSEEEDGVDTKSMVVPPAHVLLVLSS